MLEKVADLPGREMASPDYLADYWAEYRRTRGVFWKLERGQTFKEHGDASWEAFAAGDWERSLELNEQDRTEADAMARQDAEQGIATKRIRIVEFPVTPYVQWEMQFLRMLAEAGQSLRVLRAGQVAGLERQRPLPEVVILGERVMYEVRYDGEGAPCGGRRIDDPGAIARCAAQLAGLFARAEPLTAFFDREIAGLPAPAPARR
ncbi:DUF6879 family protein [Nocardiopsis potens]|uniref:DUF6879 family protein n=1 Tax=Nocardiopsis potens TaxID=1246458 RepID=UPI000349AC95|nr:DUF6879 family protein [Nocardiopsis potens]